MNTKTVRMERPGAAAPAPLPPAAPPAPPARPAAAVPHGGGPHPLIGPMYWASVDLLTLASQLALGATPPSAPELRQQLQQAFASMHARAVSSGIAPEDAGDAVYALMALFDEILVQARWPGRLEWQTSPLQYVHFHENTAGENFFRRAEVLVTQPHRAHVLLVYFCCLALGFQGRYAVAGGAGLQPVYDAIYAALARSLPASEAISPHGDPPDSAKGFLRAEAPIVRVAIGLFAAALVVFAVLRVTISAQAHGAAQSMHDYATGKP